MIYRICEEDGRGVGYTRDSSQKLLEFGTTQPYRLYIVRFFSSRKSSVTTTSTETAISELSSCSDSTLRERMFKSPPRRGMGKCDNCEDEPSGAGFIGGSTRKRHSSGLRSCGNASGNTYIFVLRASIPRARRELIEHLLIGSFLQEPRGGYSRAVAFLERCCNERWPSRITKMDKNESTSIEHYRQSKPYSLLSDA